MRFVTALDLIKCLKQIKSQRLLRTCALISEIPYDISTMAGTVLSDAIRQQFSVEGETELLWKADSSVG